MFAVDLVEWERFCYRPGISLSRPEVESMSLREYLLRRQAHTRDTMETVRLETLPILNAWAEDTVTMDDFFGGAQAMTEQDKEELRAFADDVAEMEDEDGEPLVDDWSLVGEQLA